jgi:hypothetical protein
MSENAVPWMLYSDNEGRTIQAACVDYRGSREWMMFRELKWEGGHVSIQAMRELNHWRVSVRWPGHEFSGAIDHSGDCVVCGRPIVDVVVPEEGLVLVRH